MRLAGWRGAAVAGLATLILSIAFRWIPGLEPCGPSGGSGAVIGFELVRSPAELDALFGTGTCRATMASAQRAALWLDMLGFIPAYALFFALSGSLLANAHRHLGPLAAAFALSAAILDQAEGVILHYLLDTLPGTQSWIDALWWTVRPKFALLSLAEGAIAAILIWGPRHWESVPAVAMAGGAMLSFAMLVFHPHASLMMQGHAIAWVSLFVVAASRAFVPPRASS